MNKRFFNLSMLISMIILMFVLWGVLSTDLTNMSSIFYYIILIILPTTHSIFLKLFNPGKENLWIDYFLISFLSVMSALSFSIFDALDYESLFLGVVIFFFIPLFFMWLVYSWIFNLYAASYIKFKTSNNITYFRTRTLIFIFILHIINVIKHLIVYYN